VKLRSVYQTLEDRDNPDEIEESGPFECNRNNAWLGPGYYFWESFIQNAHWWGQECNSYKNGYVICEASYELDDDLCFNLVDNPAHIEQFVNTIELMKKKKLFNAKTTVARVINYLKKDLKIFNFQASRVYGVNSKRKASEYHSTIPFKPFSYQYLDLRPAIQVCFYDRKSLNLEQYRIVYPDKYIKDYLV